MSTTMGNENDNYYKIQNNSDSEEMNGNRKYIGKYRRLRGRWRRLTSSDRFEHGRRRRRWRNRKLKKNDTMNIMRENERLYRVNKWCHIE